MMLRLVNKLWGIELATTVLPHHYTPMAGRVLVS
jgi:hypothetical protein